MGVNSRIRQRFANRNTSALPEDVLPESAPETAAPLADAPAESLLSACELESLVRLAQEMTVSDGAAIALAAGDQLVCRATVGRAPELAVRVDSNRGLSGLCVRTGEVVCWAEGENDPRINEAVRHELGIGAVVIIPIKRDGKVVGIVMCLRNRAEPYSAEDVTELTAIALLPYCWLADASLRNYGKKQPKSHSC